MTTETVDQEIVIAEAAVEAAPLTTQEQQRFSHCESIIQRGLDTFVEVGEALAEIRSERLYRQAHTSFDDYLRARWPQIGSRRQADRLIVAAEVAADLRPIGLSVANEAQARELAPLTSDERRAAMQQAVAATPGGTPTAKQIQQAAVAIRPPPAPAKTPPAVAPPTTPATTLPPALAIPAKAPTTPPVATTPPPALPPPLTPIAAVAADIDLQARKLLEAKSALLAEALLLVEAELERTTTPTTPTITISAEQARGAARLFVNSPALGGAAAMLAFAAVVEEAPPPEAEAEPTLLSIVEREVTRIEERLKSGDLTGEEPSILRGARRNLDDLVDSLDDEAYGALAERISAAEKSLGEQQEAA